MTFSEDRLNLDRLKKCLNRYEAVSVIQKALKSQVIDAFEDNEVYNKKGKWEIKNIIRTEATFLVCETKERIC